MNGVTEKSAAQLVPLSVADKPLILSLLRLGFPQLPERIWDQGFARIERSTQILNDQIALALEVDGRFEGIILTLRCQPDWAPPGYQLVNLSSWYVSDTARSHAIWMLRKVTRLPNSIFLDLSPTEGVARLSALMKFRPLNNGVVRVLLIRSLLARSVDGAKFIGARKVVASLKDTLLRARIEENIANGLIAYGLEINGEIYPLLFKKKYVRGLPVGLALYFCNDFDVFMKNMGVVARGLMIRRWMYLRFDRVSDLPPTLKYSIWSNRVRLATAGYPAGTIDLLDSESSIFGFD